MRNYIRSPRVEQGTFIVDRNGTVLGFDHAMETLTGWQAIEVVGRDKNVCGALATDRGDKASLCSGPLYFTGNRPGVRDLERNRSPRRSAATRDRSSRSAIHHVSSPSSP